MPSRSPFRSRRYARPERGVALVIVLAFVVLLSGLVLAFFSRALSERAISNSSATQTRIELFAQGASATIIGDLKQEIVAGSTAGVTLMPTTPTGSPVLYRPKPPGNGVRGTAAPAFSGFTPNMVTTVASPMLETDGLNNLLKVSTYNLDKGLTTSAFYPANPNYSAVPMAPNRAADCLTTVPSLNGRTVSPARWNKPLLMQPSSTTDNTPAALASTTFPTPAWILVARDGTNPKAASASVTGRYAYTIYNEGGLLDANVAGYPALATSSAVTGTMPPINDQTLYKNSLAYADLTQLQDFSGRPIFPGTTGQAVIDQLVGWRNSASAVATGSLGNYKFLSADKSALNFYNWATLNRKNFLTTANRTLGTGNTSDRLFTSRQQLIQFVLHGMTGTAAPTETQQHALQCLGTFSRSLNQPSIFPDPNRPKVQLKPSTADPSGNYVADTASPGGNSAYSQDGSLTSIFNPVFRSVRVGTAFTRADGSAAQVGEPLVKKRFALSRVAWITYQGPSALAAGKSILVSEYAKRGLNADDAQQLLDAGTAENVYAYFGLTWFPGKGIGGAGGFWYYNHGIANGGVPVIGSLYDLQSTTTPRDVASANRDPDFFELLKAAVNVGAIGKDWPGIGTNGYQGVQDSSVSPQIFALGANIIDEASPTQFPTTIRYMFASGDLRAVYGKTDLPYYNGDCTFPIIVQQSSARPSTDGNPVQSDAPIDGPTAKSDGTWGPAGTGALLMCPRVWDPYCYDANTQVDPSLAPSQLRIRFINPLASYNADANLNDWPPVSQTGWILTAPTPWQFDARSQFRPNPLPWVAPPSYHVDDPTPENLNPVAYINYFRFTAPWTSEDSTVLTFYNAPTLYRDTTLLFRVPLPNSVDAAGQLALGPGNAITDLNAQWGSGIPEYGSGQNFIGVLLGTFPLRFSLPSVIATPAQTPLPKAHYIYSIDDVFTRPSGKHATWQLEYLPPGSSTWIPYQDKLVVGSATDFSVAVKTQDGSAGAPYLLLPNNASTNSATGSIFYGNTAASAYGTAGSSGSTLAHEDPFDPRADRWSALGDMGLYPRFLNVLNTPASAPPERASTETYRPSGPLGGGSHSKTMPGWHRDQDAPNGNGPQPGVMTQNIFKSNQFYYFDADNVTRRAMGGLNADYAPASTYGLPMATATSNYNGGVRSNDTVNNGSNRPVLLHRPYRSVAELSYVFSDTPWKNIDFSVPESGFNALLDLFCVNDDTRADGLLAGKVDLNTRNPSVLTAMMTNAYREVLSASLVNAPMKMVSSDLKWPAKMAELLIERTTGLSGQQGPLGSISELVGHYVPGYTGIASGVSNSSNGQAYSGFTEDIPYSRPATLPLDMIQRYREAPIRALSAQGQAGTWNLMIDLIAQTGRYPANTSSLAQFAVEGEKRYWVHIAIDRQTGQVIDQQVEPVNE